MHYLYSHQGEAGNRERPSLALARHRAPQSPRPSHESGCADREEAYIPGAPSSVVPGASGVNPSRLKISRKLSGARLFFNPGPVLLYPALDLLFVPLHCPSLRLLRTPSHRPQYSPDMVDMIADAKTGVDQLGHSRACPEVGRKTCCFRSLKKLLFKLELILIVYFRRSTSGYRCLDGFRSIFQKSSFPSPYTPAIDAQLLGHFHQDA